MSSEPDNGCRRWTLPELVDTGGGTLSSGQDETSSQSYEKGFEQGRQEGEAAGRQALVEQIARFQQLTQSLARPLEDLDQEVVDSLAHLATTIAAQLVRRELKADPQQIVATVREAVGALPLATRNIQLHLHPEDARLVHELMTMPEGDDSWQIVEDVSLTRGGCMLVSENSQVVATVEARLNAVISAMLGGERVGDAGHE
jgi:flagellar assembly protein FliH